MSAVAIPHVFSTLGYSSRWFVYLFCVVQVSGSSVFSAYHRARILVLSGGTHTHSPLVILLMRCETGGLGLRFGAA